MCVCVVQAGPTVFELHGRFVDVEQQISTQQVRQHELLKVLRDTQVKTVGQYEMMIVMVMTRISDARY